MNEYIERKTRSLLWTHGFSQADIDDEITRLKETEGASISIVRPMPRERYRIFWHRSSLGSHRATARWTRHIREPGKDASRCGIFPSAYASRFAEQCTDGRFLQGHKARCKRCHREPKPRS